MIASQTLQMHIATLLASARAALYQSISLAHQHLDEAATLLTPQMPAETALYTLMRGIAYFQEGRFALAVTAYDDALARYTVLNDLEGLARVHNSMGILQRQLGDFDHAVQHFQQSIHYADLKNDLKLKTLPLNGLASLHDNRGEPSQALVYVEQCLAIVQANGDTHAEMILRNNQAIQLQSLGRHEEALRQTLPTLAYFRQHQLYVNLVEALTSAGRAYCAMKDFSTAEALLYEALELTRTHHLLAKQQTVYMELGHYYQAVGKVEAAIETFAQIIVMAETLTNSAYVYAAHRSLSELYKQQGALELALKHLERYVELRDQVITRETEHRLANLEIRFQTDMARREADMLRKRTAELELLTQINHELFSATSHDLKNPITRILLNSQLLEPYLPTDTPRPTALLGSIRQAAYMMNDLIVNVLELLRVKALVRTEKTRQPLYPLLKELITAFESSAQIRQQQLTLVCRPEMMGNFNRLDMKRAIQNLLSNAIKYAPQDSQITLSAALNASGVLTIRVENTGEMLPADDLDRLFDRFYRVEKHRLLDVEGVGLGLTITRQIVENHGGKIRVENVPPNTLCFTFTLPDNHVRTA